MTLSHEVGVAADTQVEPASPPDPALLPENVQLLLLITSKWVAQSIYVVAELGIADLVTEGPQSVEVLAEATDSHARSLHRFMRVAASVGVLAETFNGEFVSTPLSDLLRSDVPGSLRSFARMMNADFTWVPYGDVLHTVRTGEVAFARRTGKRNMFEWFADHPAEEAIFNEAMTGLTHDSADSIARSWPFSAGTTIADLGGGEGLLLSAILRATPGATGLLFDRPEVVDAARCRLASAGLGERSRCVGGDLFTSVPEGADVYILKSVLHDWDDDECRLILTNVRRACTKRGARLLVIEPVIPPLNEWDFGKLMDIEMMVNVGGRERTEPEWRDLFTSAGFMLSAIHDTTPPVWILEGVVR